MSTFDLYIARLRSVAATQHRAAEHYDSSHEYAAARRARLTAGDMESRASRLEESAGISLDTNAEQE
jgi:hypothetical protein